MSKARDIADSTTTLSVDGGTIKLDGNHPVGTANVALGNTALDSNVSGGSNTAIGADALTANTANNNTAVGYQAGYSNTTGTANVLVGVTTGYSITTAPANVAVGNAALYATTTGEYNSALGHVALYDNTTGSYNVAVGRSALQSNTTASSSTAVGYQAGYSNTVSNLNTFIGHQAGYSHSYTGSTGGNTMIGYRSGYNSTTGQFNTFLGVGSAKASGQDITTGGRNVIIGGYGGNEGSLDLRTKSNNVVLSDGDGNPWFGYADWDNNNYKSFRAQNNVAGQIIGQFRHTAASSNIYGLSIHFANAAPDDNVRFFINCTDNTATRFQVLADGDVRNHDNSYGAVSDQKLKQQIIDASSQWDDIKAIKVRKYKMNDDVTAYGDSDSLWRVGVVAQELEEAGMGGLVVESPDLDENNNELNTTTKSVKYSILYMKAVKALQEAMERIETLEAKVAALEAN